MPANKCLKQQRQKTNVFGRYHEDFHAERCPSAFADRQTVAHEGGGGGGASNAAGFLSRFVKPEGWVHLDLAAAYHGGATSEMPVGQQRKVFAQLREC